MQKIVQLNNWSMMVPAINTAKRARKSSCSATVSILVQHRGEQGFWLRHWEYQFIRQWDQNLDISTYKFIAASKLLRMLLTRRNHHIVWTFTGKWESGGLISRRCISKEKLLGFPLWGGWNPVRSHVKVLGWWDLHRNVPQFIMPFALWARFNVAVAIVIRGSPR